jgi:hypothetical protein
MAKFSPDISMTARVRILAGKKPAAFRQVEVDIEGHPPLDISCRFGEFPST